MLYNYVFLCTISVNEQQSRKFFIYIQGKESRPDIGRARIDHFLKSLRCSHSNPPESNVLNGKFISAFIKKSIAIGPFSWGGFNT